MLSENMAKLEPIDWQQPPHMHLICRAARSTRAGKRRVIANSGLPHRVTVLLCVKILLQSWEKNLLLLTQQISVDASSWHA